MRHIAEVLRMLGFVGVLGMALAAMSTAGCERNEDILKIETPHNRVDVEQRPDGGIVIDVDKN